MSAIAHKMVVVDFLNGQSIHFPEPVQWVISDFLASQHPLAQVANKLHQRRHINAWEHGWLTFWLAITLGHRQVDPDIATSNFDETDWAETDCQRKQFDQPFDHLIKRQAFTVHEMDRWREMKSRELFAWDGVTLDEVYDHFCRQHPRRDNLRFINTISRLIHERPIDFHVDPSMIRVFNYLAACFQHLRREFELARIKRTKTERWIDEIKYRCCPKRLWGLVTSALCPATP